MWTRSWLRRDKDSGDGTVGAASAPQVRMPGCALITGASQGLGRAFAAEYARRGANLALVALPDSGLAGVAQALALWHDVRVEFLELDLRAAGSPEALTEWVADKQLPISTLINNAGVGYSRRFQDSTLEENESCILLNNLALVKITRLLLPELQRQPEAFILNVASLAAFFPLPLMPVYAPSKSFILSFSLALGSELRGSPVRVSVVCPNGIRTNAACRRMIEAGGLAARLTCQTPDEVAHYAATRMLAGQRVIVPGRLNRLIAAAAPFVPSRIVSMVASTFWGAAPRPKRLRPVKAQRALRGELA